MRARNIILSLVCGILALGILGLARWPVAIAAPAPAPQPADGQEYYVYLPFVSKAPNACQEIPDAPNYFALNVWQMRDPTKPPPHNNPDYNLLLLGYVPVNEARELVLYGGDTDSLAPQFYYLFSDLRTPNILNTYRNNRWDWDNHVPLPPEPNPQPPNSWPVTVIGVEVQPLEVIHVPDSGYSIGSECGDGGCDVMVIYADRNQITLRYAREDNITPGYTIYITGICPEPRLLALYESWANRRTHLPVLRGGWPLGRAWGNQIDIAIRDMAVFGDPRSCKDHWRGRGPCQ